MTTLGVEMRHHGEAPGLFPPKFVRVESAVPDDQPCLAKSSGESSPPRGEETDTTSLRVAPYQVAGHSSKGVGLPSLVDDAGHFLKPCPDDRKGAAEVDFYRRVVHARDSGAELSTTLAGFAPYVPEYAGTFRADAAGIVAVAGDDPTAAHARTIAATGQRPLFLRLEDVTAGYSKPCVVDLKIGLRTFSRTGHDPLYIAKRSKHDTRSGQAEVGFKVCGMQTWERAGVDERENGEREAPSSKGDKKSKSPFLKKDYKQTRWLQRRRPYDWARNLCDKNAVRAALEDFVGCSGRRSADGGSLNSGAGSETGFGVCEVEDAKTPSGVASIKPPSSTPLPCRASEVFGEALIQIEGLRAWFATQRELHLLGSSVLIVYEGDPDVSKVKKQKTRVCVIDFCNYVDSGGKLDDNFAKGLERLQEMMTAIVENEEGAGEA